MYRYAIKGTKFFPALIMGLVCLMPSLAIARQSTSSTAGVLLQAKTLHIPFMENRGQVNDKVMFYARTFGGTVFLTQEGEIVYSLPEITKEGQGERGIVLKEKLVGARVKGIMGEEASHTRVSSFKGNDPSQWQKSISTYEAVILGEVYRGIKLKLRAYGNTVEKLFFIKPGSNPAAIQMRLSGARGITVSPGGELEVATELGTVRFTRPIAYQEIEGKRVEVPISYNILKHGTGDSGLETRDSALILHAPSSMLNIPRPEPLIPNPESRMSNSSLSTQHSALVYGFTVADYDHTQELIIDPLLASTFLGGGGNDGASSMAIDSSGNVYVTGVTNSSKFPVTVGAYDSTYKESDVFISKLSPDLSTLLASTFLGAGHADFASSIAIDPSGNVYVTGCTFSGNFPVTENAYDQKFNSSDYADVFISKLSPDLSTLLASTFLGAGENDGATCIKIDSSGNVYVTGWTFSSNFPITDTAFDQQYNSSGFRDAFVSKLNSDLSTLLASTFLGGGEGEWASSLATDQSGNVFVTGWTWSDNFPVTEGAYDGQFNSSGYTDAFISKFNSDLSSLLASTYLGGGGGEWTTSIALGPAGSVYVTGGTVSDNFPVTDGAYDEVFNSNEATDAFIAKLSSDLGTLLASTYLGGGSSETAASMAIDATGNVYVTGLTFSNTFPTTPGAYDLTFNSSDYSDAFISKLNTNLTTLLASTYLGGNGDERPGAVAIDETGNIYVTGATSSSSFPTTDNAYSQTSPGGFDVFISRLDTDLSYGSSFQWSAISCQLSAKPIGRFVGQTLDHRLQMSD